MIDHIKTQVEQRLVFSGISLKQRPDIQLQLVEHLLIYIAVTVDEITEELVLLDGLQVDLCDLDTSCSGGVSLNFHNHNGFNELFIMIVKGISIYPASVQAFSVLT